jgi:hypothetical protein
MRLRVSLAGCKLIPFRLFICRYLATGGKIPKYHFQRKTRSLAVFHRRASADCRSSILWFCTAARGCTVMRHTFGNHRCMASAYFRRIAVLVNGGQLPSNLTRRFFACCLVMTRVVSVATSKVHTATTSQHLWIKLPNVAVQMRLSVQSHKIFNCWFKRIREGKFSLLEG